MIVDGAVLSRLSWGQPPANLRALLLAFAPDAEIPPLDHVDAAAAPMVATVNHGYWIARCECRTPGDVSPGCIVWLDRPWGWCVRCDNAAAGGYWRPVVLPPDRAAIEAVLVLRPDVATRNWLPGETVGDLVAENIANGVPVPEGAD